MSESEGFWCFVMGIILGVVISIFMWSAIVNVEIKAIQEDAIKHKVGEYYIDDKHEKDFRWVKDEN